jgi:hypothetical protein
MSEEQEPAADEAPDGEEILAVSTRPELVEFVGGPLCGFMWNPATGHVGHVDLGEISPSQGPTFGRFLEANSVLEMTWHAKVWQYRRTDRGGIYEYCPPVGALS